METCIFTLCLKALCFRVSFLFRAHFIKFTPQSKGSTKQEYIETYMFVSFTHEYTCYPVLSVQHPKARVDATDVSSWPAVEISLECFRLILPTKDFSSILLLGIGALGVTSSLDYPTSDIRYVVSQSAFRRLSSERKQLPAYQMDAYAVSLWGLRQAFGRCVCV